MGGKPPRFALAQSQRGGGGGFVCRKVNLHSQYVVHGELIWGNGIV